MKDRYALILLTVIAVSLAVLALHTTLEFFGSSALAQLSYIGNPQKTTNLDVYVVRDIPIEKIKNVHILGDNKTFIVQKSDGVTVYRVDSSKDNR